MRMNAWRLDSLRPCMYFRLCSCTPLRSYARLLVRSRPCASVRPSPLFRLGKCLPEAPMPHPFGRSYARDLVRQHFCCNSDSCPSRAFGPSSPGWAGLPLDHFLSPPDRLICHGHPPIKTANLERVTLRAGEGRRDDDRRRCGWFGRQIRAARRIAPRPATSPADQRPAQRWRCRLSQRHQVPQSIESPL